MATVYTDGAGSYFQCGNVNAILPLETDVNVRTSSVYTTQPMVTLLLPLTGWTVAPGLTDIGGGVWVGGLLVDPPVSS